MRFDMYHPGCGCPRYGSKARNVDKCMKEALAKQKDAKWIADQDAEKTNEAFGQALWGRMAKGKDVQQASADAEKLIRDMAAIK